MTNVNELCFVLVLSEKKKWTDGGFDGPVIGYNIKLTAGSELTTFISSLENLIRKQGFDVKSRTSGAYSYLPVRGNTFQSDSV